MRDQLHGISRTGKVARLFEHVAAPVLSMTKRIWRLQEGGLVRVRTGRGYMRRSVERLWWSVKYEDIYLHAYETPRQVRLALTSYFSFYNARRPHQSLEYRTPDELYFGNYDMKKAA